ncbi:MAG: HEAT repeat domain-containing protein [Candidatus Thermoplasmatota archaeon]|nr:HEAT repeat domain-containing protein [Candidatus Thermoplasmatota archaeon]
MTEERIPITSPFDSVDPAPPSQITEITQLRHTLCDENERMFQRMRALFALRNMGGDESVDALCAAFNSESALLKHEIAYVLGQMQNGHAVPTLIERLSDEKEDLMVRHEAAEALGAIGDRTAMDTLARFVDDPEPVISESCEVAIDLLEWVQSKEFEYH